MVVGSSTSDNEFKPTGDPVTSIPSERVLSCCSVLVYSKIICTQVKKKVMISFEILKFPKIFRHPLHHLLPIP
jgi:hypothetical protein